MNHRRQGRWRQHILQIPKSGGFAVDAGLVRQPFLFDAQTGKGLLDDYAVRRVGKVHADDDVRDASAQLMGNRRAGLFGRNQARFEQIADGVGF